MSFAPEGALITGKNGIGKTNLLEAIAYSAYGKSIRSAPDSEVILFNQTFFHLEGYFQYRDKPLNIRISFSEGKKNIRIGQDPVHKISELYRYLKIIYFSPDDIMIISGSPRLRRHFFDQAIGQYDFSYIEILRNYLHILQQRNAMLKTPFDPHVKKAWDDKFMEAGTMVVEARKRYLDIFMPLFRENYMRISNSGEGTDVIYNAAEIDYYSETIHEDYSKYIKQRGQKEIAYQRSLIGPHLDDITFMINGHPARDFGSQGQQRSLAICMRLTQAQLVQKHEKENPILIFDDVLSDLDTFRTKQIISMMSTKSQVFIATPNQDLYKDYKLPIFEIKDVEQDSDPAEPGVLQ
jgi:DNA replication and repair protein RecF